MNEKCKISVYLDEGRIFEYEVDSYDKVREHTSANINGGYRHNDGDVFEDYPPYTISKIKSNNIPTNYKDTVTGT